LRKGLSEQGYFEGRNFVFEPRTTEDYNQLPAAASELIARRVAVMFTFPPASAAQVAKAATSMIPIVFVTGADPVILGLVASLNIIVNASTPTEIDTLSQRLLASGRGSFWSSLTSYFVRRRSQIAVRYAACRT
jgi:putative ABC transport system substrate-binding protein